MAKNLRKSRMSEKHQETLKSKIQGNHRDIVLESLFLSNVHDNSML